MKKILIIHVGGTFGMIKENNTFIVKNDILKKELKKLSIFNQIRSDKDLESDFIYKNKNNETIFCDFKEISILKDSSDSDNQDYLNYSKIIEENYNKYCGFIIIHGTDTIAYSASAISFLIENLSKPIIFTGAMISLTQPGTDAIDNLTGALESISMNLKPIIYIYFNKKLYNGNRVTKIKSNTKDAFISDSPLSNFIISDTFSSINTNKIKFYDMLNAKIARIVIHPYMNYELLDYTFNNNDGIFIEAYGSGNIPNKLFKLFVKYSKTKIIVIVSQCLYGKVVGDYDIGNKTLNLENIINGKDIRPAAGLAKLVFLLSNFKFNQIKILYEKNLRDEISNN